MARVISEILLFSCMAAFVTGIVIAAASLLSYNDSRRSAALSVLLGVSWAFVLTPGLTWRGKEPGVPVKNYIVQSAIFAICASARADLTAFRGSHQF
jgi:putative flippase GtrA